MGTEVLQPRDLLVERFHVSPPSFHRRRNFPATEHLTNLIVHRRPSHNKRTSPKPDKKRYNETKKVTHGSAAAEARRRDDRSGSSMGQVTILKRGESLDSLTAKVNAASPKPKPADDLEIFVTGPKQIRPSPPPRPDIYAGSAFSQSPSPRSLPLPSFFNKKQQDGIDDPATRDLRRLLRLE